MGRPKISNERFEAVMQKARVSRYLQINARYANDVPEHIDEAAREFFRSCEGMIAAGATPPGAPARAAAKAGLGVKALAVILSAAVIGAGSYFAVPAVKEAANGVWELGQAEQRQSKLPTDYIIPSPGEEYEVKEDVSTENLAVKWFSAERRLLLVQIADALPELPEELGETVLIGGSAAFMSEAEGMWQLVMHDGDMLILMQMYNVERQELTDYAEMFAAANGI